MAGRSGSRHRWGTTLGSRRGDWGATVRRVWAYVDAKLPDSDRERVTRHLEECADCLSHFDFARAFLDAVHAARPPVKEDEALRARVIASLNDQGVSI